MMMQVWGQRLRRWLVATLFVFAGVMHLLHPKLFEAVIPPGFGPPTFDVMLSGVAEIVGGLALVVPAAQCFAVIWLEALLVAVWPANWYMAIEGARFAALAPGWMFWLRVPLQFVLFALVWYAADRAARLSIEEWFRATFRGIFGQVKR